MKVILHSKSNNNQHQKLSSTQTKTTPQQIIFNQQSNTSLNDKSSDEIDFGVNVLDNCGVIRVTRFFLTPCI